jgi:hypothetical protein
MLPSNVIAFNFLLLNPGKIVICLRPKQACGERPAPLHVDVAVILVPEIQAQCCPVAASVRSAPVCVLLFLFIIFYAAKAQTTRESVSGYLLPMRSSFLKK